MKVPSLGLLGRNISHSLSPQVYQNFLGKIDYHLFDFQRAKDIPPLKELAANLDGLSVTAPYKTHFLKEVAPTPVSLQFGALNCIKQKGDQLMADLTDYYAVSDIFDRLAKSYQISRVYILGSGVMASLTAEMMEKRGLPFEILSRRNTENFEQLNLGKKSGKGVLVINACARDYCYNGELDKNTLFWDYNYNMPTPCLPREYLGENYIDGISLLYGQAKHSLKFWNLKF